MNIQKLMLNLILIQQIILESGVNNDLETKQNVDLSVKFIVYKHELFE